MSSANTILNQLGTDIKDKFKSTLGYKTDPLIKYGRFMWNEVQTNPPALCYCDTGITMLEILGDMGSGYIDILLYGYADYDGISDTSAIRDLALDTMYFLYNDYTYTDKTEIVSEIEIIPGGESRPVSVFTLDIRVRFDYTHSNINN